jgi:hypothetical protein
MRKIIEWFVSDAWNRELNDLWRSDAVPVAGFARNRLAG